MEWEAEKKGVIQRETVKRGRLIDCQNRDYMKLDFLSYRPTAHFMINYHRVIELESRLLIFEYK